MILVKILGLIDLISAFVFLMLAFSINPWIQVILFCAGLLLLKGLFILSGEPLSAIDLISAIFLLLSLIITLPTVLIWIPAFLLIAKGLVSFM